MPALDFPSSPVDGQIFGNYTYDSGVAVWRATPQVASGLPAGTIVQWPGAVAPTSWLICDGSAVSRSTYASLFAAIGTQYGSGDGSTTFNLPNLKGRVAVGLDASQTEFNTLGEVGGAKTHTLTTSEMPSHTHTGTTSSDGAHTHTFSGTTSTDGAHTHTYFKSFNNGVSSAGGSSWGVWAGDQTNTTSSSGSHSHTYSGTTSGASTNHTHTFTTSSVGSDGAHNNLQPYIVLNYIIKTSAGVTSGDSELATRVGAVEVRATSLETADASTNRSGLIPVLPSLISVAGGGTASANLTGTVTFSGVTSLILDGLFTSVYRNYHIVLSDGNVSGYISSIGFRYVKNGAVESGSTAYRYAGRYQRSDGATGNINSNGASYIDLTAHNTVAGVFNLSLDALSPFAGLRPGIMGSSGGWNGAFEHRAFGGWLDAGVANNYGGFAIFSTNSNTISGTVQVYGYR